MIPKPFTDVVTLDRDGAPLTAYVAGAPVGAAPVVVAAHGITASALAWCRLAAELGTDVTLVALDLRGRGASSRHPGPYGMAAHGGDAIAALDALGADHGVLVGHSMGATT